MNGDDQGARVAPLTAGADGQDLPRRNNGVEVTAAERPDVKVDQQWHAPDGRLLRVVGVQPDRVAVRNCETGRLSYMRWNYFDHRQKWHLTLRASASLDLVSQVIQILSDSKEDWCIGLFAAPIAEEILRARLRAAAAPASPRREMQENEEDKSARVGVVPKSEHGDLPRESNKQVSLALEKLMASPPWEYYGPCDDERCFFCGEDRRDYNDNPTDDLDLHKADCLFRLWHQNLLTPPASPPEPEQ